MFQWILPLFILIFFEAIADVFAKNWSSRGGLYWSVAALAGYLLANIFWLFALRNGSGLGRGAIIFSVASAVIAVTLGFLFYHEQITTIQIAGVTLGIISIMLILWG